MRWPFVRRSELYAVLDDLAAAQEKLDACRAKLRDKKTMLRELRARTIAAESLADTLRGQLERSEVERTDATLKLVRVGFGINPFTDLNQTSALPEQPQEMDSPPLSPNASPEEVMATFVREAAAVHGNDLRKISRYVERRQTEYYAHREAPAIVTPAEMAEAERVARDLEAAIEEGAREAAKG